jgi:hypothetical protein
VEFYNAYIFLAGFECRLKRTLTFTGYFSWLLNFQLKKTDRFEGAKNSVTATGKNQAKAESANPSLAS